MKLMKAMLILMTGLILIGCKTTTLHTQYPIIPIPERPKVSKDLTEDDFKKLIKYATQLEIGINEYNIYAQEQNKKVNEHFKGSKYLKDSK